MKEPASSTDSNALIRVLVVGCGNMGSSHAKSYHQHDGFQIVGLVDQGDGKNKLQKELNSPYDLFDDYPFALKRTKPDAVCICTYPDTHYEFGCLALQHNCHVFIEKPLATTVEDCQKLINLASEKQKQVVVGYILRHHRVWVEFINQAHQLGKPLVMRMNLNQQSSGHMWQVHKSLMASLSPIVDCGVHYLDVMCQMVQSKPVSVSAIGVRLSDEVSKDNYNYGQLQIRFDDGSVGWYEAGWGPMISETAFFIKDVMGPKGSVSIISEEGIYDSGSDDIEKHTKSNVIKIHHAAIDHKGQFIKGDEFIRYQDDPSHQELCDNEQDYFYKAITQSHDLEDHLQQALESLKIALACDQAVKNGKTIFL
ncbi:MAG: Gfo/Idh/MocA family oxidoreductase [Flavobacteriaceae bacterium]|nr:Gfo/Idh/MocA family oxidoreductase [Flavobacteriaceae bacterium]